MKQNAGRGLSAVGGGTLQIKCWDGCDEMDHFLSFFDISPQNVNSKPQTSNPEPLTPNPDTSTINISTDQQKQYQP